MARLNSLQKAAVARILIDLIKADMVIAHEEIELYRSIKASHNITPDDEKVAFGMTLDEAVEALRQVERGPLDDLLGTFHAMTASDGSCPREEVLLILALDACLKTAQEPADILSHVIEEPWFDERQVLYVESYHDQTTNAEIQLNYRTIANEFRLCGLDFVYLPNIIRHYNTTEERELFLDVVRMLHPLLPTDFAKALLSELRLIKTDTFCTRHLADKLGLSELGDTDPALLLRINQSRVGDKVMTNFLRLPVMADTLVKTVRSFTDAFWAFHSADRIIVSNKRDRPGAFLYKGFYRQLFEILLFRKIADTHILVDLFHQNLSFPETGLTVQNIHRKEKAFYILCLYYSRQGGLKLQKTTDKVIELARRHYAIIYHALGGEEGNVPDITSATIRNPIVATLRRNMLNCKGAVDDVNRFIVSLDRSTNRYSIAAEPELFLSHKITHTDDGPQFTQESFFESDLAQRLDQVK